MANETVKNELVVAYEKANKPATLKAHASAITTALKTAEKSKGTIVAHIYAIDKAELWKDAADDTVENKPYKSVNAYLIDALDISPAAASLWLSVARMVVDGDGHVAPWLAPFSVSQLQELLPLNKILDDTTGESISEDTLADAGIVPEMSCKAIRDAVKAYMATPAAESEDAGESEDESEAETDEGETASTFSDYVLAEDDSEDVLEWLAAVPESVRDAVTTVLYKRA